MVLIHIYVYTYLLDDDDDDVTIVGHEMCLATTRITIAEVFGDNFLCPTIVGVDCHGRKYQSPVMPVSFIIPGDLLIYCTY